MNDTNKVYKVLISILGLVVALEVFLVWLVFLPKQEELESVREDVNLIIDKLRGSKWPMDSGKLEQYIAELQMEIDGGKSPLVKNSILAMERCQVTFRDKLRAEYGNVQDFMRNASRMDYQAEYNRIIEASSKKGIVLSPSSLNLDEEIGTQYMYQPLMQLWTVEKLLSLAVEAGLEVESAKGGDRHAFVSVKPMKAYYMKQGAERPYLLEFPVEITVMGGVRECLAYLDSLNGDGVFLPPVSFEIFALPPVAGRTAQGGRLKMHLVCSSFLAGSRGL